MSEFWQEYTHLLTDPAHIAFELTLVAIVDGMIRVWLVPRWIKRHDKEVHGHG